MVIPVHDANPTRRTPVVTYFLIFANVVVFVLSPVALAPLLGDSSLARYCATDAFFRERAAVPQEVVDNEPLPPTRTVVETDQGPAACPAPEPFQKSPFLSVLTAMFAHGGWLHLLGNMLYLFVFGNNVEDRLGRLRFAAFYLICGYVATYGFALSDPDSTTFLVGASGAVAGVLGAYLMLFPKARVIALVPFLFFIPLRLPAWSVLGSWFLLQYFYTAGAGLTSASGGGVAYLAHVVGFAIGALLVLPLRGQPYGDRRLRERAARRRAVRGGY